MPTLQEAAMRKALKALELYDHEDLVSCEARHELRTALVQQGYKPSCLHGDDDYCKACYMQETTAALPDIIPVQPNIKNQIFTDISSPRPKGIEDALFRPSLQ